MDQLVTSYFPTGQTVFGVRPTVSLEEQRADLSVVIQALRANDISYVAFDKGGVSGGDIVDKFHKDTSISVFLLHAEKER